MNRVHADDLTAFTKTLEGPLLHTRPQSRPFNVTVTETPLTYWPVAGLRRFNQFQHVQSVLDRFNGIYSFRRLDYLDLNRNATYLLPILEIYFED